MTTTLGALRWDVGYYGTLTFVDMPQRHCTENPTHQSGAPFWTTLHPSGKTIEGVADQAAMDAEIAFANTGKINYWAILRYRDYQTQGRTVPDPGLVLYQSSAARGALKWCTMEQFGTFGNFSDYAGKLGRIVTECQQAHYMKVQTNRPLIYLFCLSESDLVKYFTNRANAKTVLDALRADIIAAGMGNPYIVVMVSSHVGALSLMTALGCDAVSQYSAYVPDVVDATYAQLRASTIANWDDFRLAVGKYVPVAMSGWNQTSQRDRPPFTSISAFIRKGARVTAATDAEMAAHFAEARAFVEAYPAVCDAETILAYSWNEFTEGVRTLCPTRGNPGTHLPLIAAVMP